MLSLTYSDLLRQGDQMRVFGCLALENSTKSLPIICLDARHANGSLAIRGHDAYIDRALSATPDTLVGMRVQLEN